MTTGKQTFLITGGAGFIGSHLAETLLEDGHGVIVLDNLSTGSIENIRHLKARTGFEYVIDDVMNKRLTAELVDRADGVFHLAAAVGVKLILESPVRTIETNVGATELILELADKKKRPVLITSTSEVYGKSEKLPFTETDDLVLGPSTRRRWAYACSKLLDEFLALAYFMERKLPVIIVRLFNTVGPRQAGRYGMVLPNFVEAALNGTPLSVFGTGDQSRCFCFVGDVVVALKNLMFSDAYGEVFNIGSDREISIMQVAELVKKVLKSDSPIECIPYDEAYESGFEDMMRRVPSIEKIRSRVGFNPSVGLEQIIERTAEYYRTRSAASERAA